VAIRALQSYMNRASPPLKSHVGVNC